MQTASYVLDRASSISDMSGEPFIERLSRSFDDKNVAMETGLSQDVMASLFGQSRSRVDQHNHKGGSGPEKRDELPRLRRIEMDEHRARANQRW